MLYQKCPSLGQWQNYGYRNYSWFPEVQRTPIRSNFGRHTIFVYCGNKRIKQSMPHCCRNTLEMLPSLSNHRYLHEWWIPTWNIYSWQLSNFFCSMSNDFYHRTARTMQTLLNERRGVIFSCKDYALLYTPDQFVMTVNVPHVIWTFCTISSSVYPPKP